jgi:hypothetical protein
MSRGSRKRDAARPAASAEELRAERARLTAEIERRERAETGITAGQRAS